MQSFQLWHAEYFYFMSLDDIVENNRARITHAASSAAVR